MYYICGIFQISFISRINNFYSRRLKKMLSYRQKVYDYDSFIKVRWLFKIRPQFSTKTSHFHVLPVRVCVRYICVKSADLR